MRARTLLLICLLAGSACTNLGPMPGMTMSDPVPDPRAGLHGQFGAVPGYFLSDGAREHPSIETAPLPQLAAWLEPGTLIDQGKGLGVGLRYVGGDGGGWFEPMFRYRSYLDDTKQFAASGVVYGTVASGQEARATYGMTRVGGELGFDVRVTPANEWIELHFTGGVSLTHIRAQGSYCINLETGYGRDCDTKKDDQPDTTVAVLTALPAGFIGAHVDVFRDLPVLHGARLGVVLAAGLRPEFRYGEVGDKRMWYSIGAQIAVGVGETLEDD